MKIRALFAKPKFYFLAIAPLLLATAVFKVDCPVCRGQGAVVGSNHMDSVRILAVESRIIDSIQDACTGYIVTKACPFIKAYNLSTDDAEGWLTIELINTDSGELLAKQYLPVKVAAEMTVSLDSLVVFAFYSADIPPNNLDITVSALTGTVPCAACNGSNKVNFNTYFLAKAFKNKLVYETVQATPFGPDISHGEPGSREWMDWNEIPY